MGVPVGTLFSIGLQVLSQAFPEAQKDLSGRGGFSAARQALIVSRHG